MSARIKEVSNRHSTCLPLRLIRDIDAQVAAQAEMMRSALDRPLAHGHRRTSGTSVSHSFLAIRRVTEEWAEPVDLPHPERQGLGAIVYEVMLRGYDLPTCAADDDSQANCEHGTMCTWQLVSMAYRPAKWRQLD